MIDRENIKKKLGNKNIIKLKKVLGCKKVIIASWGGYRHKFKFNQTIFDECIEIKIKGKHVFFGYYDLQQLNTDGDKALIHILDKEAKAGKDNVKLAYYDIIHGNIVVFAESKAWSWQQGTRLRWHPVLEGCVLYNDYNGTNYVTYALNINTRRVIETLPVALYDISKNGRYGLSLNFIRLQRLRPGYGYSCCKDETEGIFVPDQDGIFLWDNCNHVLRKIISLSNLAEVVNDTKVEHYLNHISISPSGTKFIFFHLWSAGLGTKWNMRFYVCNIDGTGLTCIEDTEIISHYCWKDEDTLLTTALSNKYIAHSKYILYDLKQKTKKIIESTHLMKDGHPTYLLKKKSFVSDTYPMKNSVQYVFISNENGKNYVELLSAYANPFLIDEYRCDLHPRVDCLNNWISVDSTYTGVRSVILLHERKIDER